MPDEFAKPAENAPNSSAVTLEKQSPENSSLAGSLPQSPEHAQDWLEKTEKFVKLVAENLRYGSWTKRFVTIGGAAFLVFNPVSAGKVGEFFDRRELPKWYVPAFAMGMGGIAIGAVGAAIVTLPKRTLEAIPERQAIKGLRSFEQKDAEIFKRLERQRDVQDCLDALDMEDLRLFLLVGESGVGKSSLLQAGLMPNLGHVGLGAVYVKLSDRDPIELIRKALGAGEKEEFVAMLRSAVEKAGKPIVLILDQFEQFFVQFQEAERGRLIGALKDWYESEVPVKILIGIRGDLSDRLIEIQKALGYSLRPSQVHRLEKFAPEQATEVLRVIAETEEWSFNAAFVQEMTRDELAGLDGKIAPVEVQVLAQMVSREPNEDNRRFDRTAFQRLGGVDGLLGRSLQRSLDAILVKSERERALEVLLALTNLDRNVRSGAFSIGQLQGMTEKVHGSPSEVAAAVGWLSESRLITPVEGEGEVRYELAHERLIPALRQVANQELSEANKANLLLDRRVNEWLGSGKSRRYLFSLKELRLLRQQRGFLEWGQKHAQKHELLRRSWQRATRNLGVVSTPIALAMAFGIWSYTPEGRIQWARWQLIEADRLVDLEQENRDEVFTALTLDALDSAQAPLPLWQYFGWAGPTLAAIQEPIIEAAQKFGELKDQGRAKQLLEQLLALSTINREASTKAGSLSAIAEAYSQLGDGEKSKQILSQALDLTKSVQEESTKVYSLSSIAKAAGKLGDRERGKQILSQALDLTKSIQESSRVYSLSAIAEAYGKLGDREKGKQILSQALDLAKSMQEESNKIYSFKVYSFSDIAEAYGKLGDEEKSKQILSQALDLAKSIQEEYSKAYSLRSIAEVYSQLGDEEKGKQILSQALDQIKSMQGESSTMELLSSIAEAASQLEDGEKGKQILSQALDQTKSIREEYSRAYSLRFIAEAAGKLGDREKGKQILSQALDLTKSMQGESMQANSLHSIAAAYSQLGDEEKGKQILSQALDLTKSMQEEFSKTDSLRSIAEAASKLGDGEKGKQILSQALDLTKSIQEESSKADSLSAIAGAYFKLGDRTQAKNILADATKSADIDQKSYSSRQVAELHAELGNWREALRLSQRCNGNDKVAVLARIIRVHAEQKHPEFKALRDKEEKE